MKNLFTTNLSRIAYYAATDNLDQASIFINNHIEEYGKLGADEMMRIFDEMANIRRSRARETSEWNDSLNIESYTL